MSAVRAVCICVYVTPVPEKIGGTVTAGVWVMTGVGVGVGEVGAGVAGVGVEGVGVEGSGSCGVSGEAT